MIKTKIINLFGGPGVGKSTTAAKVFSELQLKGYKCDLPYEFPKQVAWESNVSQISDQSYIFSNQHRGIVRSFGKVDYIILDSPILLSIVYKNRYHQGYPSNLYGDSFDNFVLEVFKGYDNINFVLERNTETFEENGRLQTKEESLEIDNDIVNLLTNNDIDYVPINQTNDIGDRIAEHLVLLDKSEKNIIEIYE
jgi:hypothetical protein